MGMKKISINRILEKNKSKSFVKRILDYKNSPILKNPDGTISTHSMEWAEKDGKFYVYPTVLKTSKGLRRFSSDEAWVHTQNSGNYIEFDTAAEADYFSKHYKDFWKNEVGNENIK